jgi:hypothetical protein
METVSLSALPARNIGQEWLQTLRVLHGRIALAHAARRLHPARTASCCRVVDTTQMHLNDQFGDDMSENHAALGLGVGAIDLLELAKDVRVVVLWDTRPTSLTLALRWRSRFGCHARRARFGELDGTTLKIEENLDGLAHRQTRWVVA